MRNLYLIFCCFLALSGFIHAQPTFDDFGKLNEDNVFQMEYDGYPDAPAIILFELGEISLIDQANKLMAYYKVHRRIKILQDEGLDWAKVVIPFSKRNREDVKLLKGATYFVDTDGGINEIKLNKRTASKVATANPDSMVYKFPLPGVREGAVIEYVYEFVSENIQSLKPWKFQKEIPVMYSRVDTYIPRRVSYIPVFQGDMRRLKRQVGRFSYQQNNPYQTARGLDNLGFLPTYYSQGFVMGNSVSYEMEDIMPLKPEPYTTIPEDNISQVTLELANLRLTGRNRVKTWKSMSRSLLRDNFFGRDLEDDAFTQLVESEFRQIRRQEDKAEAIFRFVQDQVKWDGYYAPKGTQRLLDVIKSGKGNGADMNLLLCALMRAAKFDSHPILISTRDHGKPQKYRPDIFQFNHVIVSTKIRGKVYMLDALSQGVPFDMIPRRDLNDMGFLVDKRSWGWIDIVPEHEVIRNTYTRFFLNEDGSLDGELELIFKEYSAATQRGKLQAYSGQEAQYIREEFLQGLPEARMHTYAVSNPPEIESPVTVLCKLSTPDYVMEVNDLMFVRPLLTKSILDNPFSSEERIAPIDLPCPIREYYLLGLEIPEGYEVVQTPSPIRVVMPNKAGEFSYNVIVDEGIIHVSSTIFITKTHYYPQEYEEIKAFFDYIVRKHEEDIVLRKADNDVSGD